ncbi:MAG TPA: cupin domain-containing protein [Chloroflexia bacterium]|nr:cupin domain-containing protein [Chloroflexia bacterium]
MADAKAYLTDDSFVLGPGEGKAIISPGGTVLIRVRGEDTGGAWAAVETAMPPGTPGPPLHINTREDEMLYVLTGTLRLQLGERTIDVPPGALAFVPRGSAHTFCNPYNEPVRFLSIISPAGLEKYFDDSAELMESTHAGTPPDVAKLIALLRSYGGIIVGPPMHPA